MRRRERLGRTKLLVAASEKLFHATDYLHGRASSQGIYRELGVSAPELVAAQDVLFLAWRRIIDEMVEIAPTPPKPPLRYRVGCWLAGIERYKA